MFKNIHCISPHTLRALIRKGIFRSQTSGYCPGYAQANLVVLPKKYAYDFLLFAQRNPSPCPILEVTDEGSRFLKDIALGADIASDIPKYRVYRRGVLECEVNNVTEYWQPDFVSFLIGCSFSFEGALIASGVPVRHIEEGVNVPMYKTNIPCKSAGIMKSNMVVSMRPMLPCFTDTAIRVTTDMSRVHGGPVFIGDPKEIGIKDISTPDFGSSVTIKEGEVCVFWACGVTPQLAIMNAKPDIAITHSPGHMLVTDISNESLRR